MAGHFWVASASGINLTASTATVIMTLEPATNVRNRLLGYTLTLKGVAAIDITLRLVELTGTITGTGVTLKRSPDLGSETFQIAAKTGPSGYSVSASPPHVLKYLQGSFAENLDLLLLGGGKYGLEVTAASACTVGIEVRGEE